MDGGLTMADINWKTKEQIEEETKEQPDRIGVLEQTQSDLIFNLMMNGVL